MKIIPSLLFMACWALASQARALTLDEAIQNTLNSHPSLNRAQASVDIARREKRINSWLSDPKARIEFEEIGANDFSPGNAEMVNYGISQEIPFPGTLAAQAKKGRAAVKSMEFESEATRRGLIFEVKKTYIELLAAQRLLQLRREVAGAYRQLSASLETKYRSSSGHETPPADMDAGEAGEEGSLLGDVFMSRMKALESDAEIDDLIHKTKSLQAKLNLMMGRSGDEKLGSLKPVGLKSLKITLNKLEEKLLSQNSDLNALKWLIERSRQDKKIAALGLVPTLEPEFTYNQRKDRENAYTLGIGMNLPLWLNRNAAEIKKGKLEEMRARSEFGERQVTLKEDLHYLYNHAVQHYKMVQKYKNQIVPLSQSAFRVTRAAYDTGATDSRDMLQKLVGYLDASKMYWDLWGDYQIEYALLEQLVGEDL